jgi:aromatic ring-opening dioxygenase catalytic subunit (LigB family)
MSSVQFPTLFVSHGGGPWPYIAEMKTQFAETVKSLTHLPKTLPEKPKAILCVTAHWEANEFTVSGAKNPEMIYDYSGFPEHTYHIKYPAPGSPEVASRVHQLLSDAKIPNHIDPNYGFDHGTFVPMTVMYPEADIPVVSMSIKSNYSPEDHLKMGEALRPLRNEGILIIASGLSYHNMRGFGTSGADLVSKQFGHWLEDTVTEKDFEKRKQLLRDWQKAPAARLAHPREDHLVPLMVAVGAAGPDAGHVEFVDHVFDVDMVSYRFGGR